MIHTSSLLLWTRSKSPLNASPKSQASIYNWHLSNPWSSSTNHAQVATSGPYATAIASSSTGLFTKPTQKTIYCEPYPMRSPIFSKGFWPQMRGRMAPSGKASCERSVCNPLVAIPTTRQSAQGMNPIPTSAPAESIMSRRSSTTRCSKANNAAAEAASHTSPIWDRHNITNQPRSSKGGRGFLFSRNGLQPFRRLKDSSYLLNPKDFSKKPLTHSTILIP